VAIGIVVMFVNIAASLLLMNALRVGGLALALSFSQVLNFVLLLLWLERKVGSTGAAGLAAPVAKSAAAAALMGTALRLTWPLLHVDGAAFAVRAAALAGAIAAGIALYLGLVRLISPADLKSVLGLLKRAAVKENP
jgi:putative peptidoglycan lipid II flippase